MSQIKALLWMVVIFLLGSGVGAFGLHLWQAHQPNGEWRPATVRNSPPPLQSMLDVQFHLEELSQELDLTPEQLEDVRSVLANASNRGVVLHEDVLPKVIGYLEITKNELRDVLDVEQQQRLDRLHSEHQRAFHHFLLGQGTHLHSRNSGGHSRRH